MKNLFFPFLIVLILGCEGKCDDLTERIINGSGRKIEITSYKNYYPNIPFGTFSKKNLIENNAFIERRSKSCPPSIETVSIGQLVEGDSIVIDFGDKKLRYGNKDLSSRRNPYYLSLYFLYSGNFVYNITEDDYANALP